MASRECERREGHAANRCVSLPSLATQAGEVGDALGVAEGEADAVAALLAEGSGFAVLLDALVLLVERLFVLVGVRCQAGDGRFGEFALGGVEAGRARLVL